MNRILFLLALLPALCFGQSYPSPTFQGITVISGITKSQLFTSSGTYTPTPGAVWVQVVAVGGGGGGGGAGFVLVVEYF